MEPQAQQRIIEHYIDSYNRFDIAGMLVHLHPDIIFRNISNGQVTMSLTGITAFKEQAKQATSYFSERQQSITAIHFQEESAEVLIDYKAVLAIDLPNSLKAGDTLQLQGKSVFSFKEDRIISIDDLI